MTETNKGEARGGVEAVERAIAILRCFQQPGETLTLAVLAQRSALYKSTILRIAGSLLRAGFIQKTTAGHYQLGPELRRLGRLSRAKFSLEPMMRPILRRLCSATKETASFYVREGNRRVCLYRQNSTLSTRHHLEEGATHPLREGAAGILLAWHGSQSSNSEARALRRNGFVVSAGDRDRDLSAVAVPVVNRHGELIGALTISGPISRFDTQKIDLALRLLVEAAKDLQSQLPRHDSIDLLHGEG